MSFITDPGFRKWLYPVLIAAIALGSGYGFLNAEEAERWNVLINAVLGMGGLGVARAFVTPKVPAVEDMAIEFTEIPDEEDDGPQHAAE